jgi:hypothetical protein
MLKERKKISTIILTLLTLLSCSERTSEQENETKVVDNFIDKKSTSQKSTFDQDSIDFLKAIKSLENINFLINGQDSIVVTKDPTDLIELNTTKSTFHNSYAKADTGLIKYKTVDLVRKYHVKLKDDKSGARPSANIIQMTFKDNQEANDWFSVYYNCPHKSAIQGKPRTELWLQNNHVYFVQTYHTPERDYVNLIKKTIIETTRN